VNTVTRTMLEQIGRMTILATSGGRIVTDDEHDTITLPVSNGYRVVVKYNRGSDTYTVARTFTRAGRVFDKGTVTDVYADQLDDAVYRAGCFRNVPWGAR
jgi:hypothetical protein